MFQFYLSSLSTHYSSHTVFLFSSASSGAAGEKWLLGFQFHFTLISSSVFVFLLMLKETEAREGHFFGVHFSIIFSS